MASDFQKQLKRGVLEMIVLSTVCREASYGYEIIKRLNQTSLGVFAVKEGTLYPILYRLEDEGLIRSRWGENLRLEPTNIEAEIKKAKEKPRKMYSATAKGHVRLIEMQQIWQNFINATNSLIE